ncbi:MAG: zf-TFIIB domain-containing protein [Fimbriimonadaceae bacterium]|nr:zf-TFIIB domain-containing protein [Fimbriimonadaceae bacterium]
MNCPRGCDAVLAIADRGGIEVDYCPLCRGVWLDRGELDKLIERQSEVMRQAVPTELPGYKQAWGEPERTSPSQSEPPRDRYHGRSRDSYDEDFRKGKRKKRGLDFLDDIFDF